MNDRYKEWYNALLTQDFILYLCSSFLIYNGEDGFECSFGTYFTWRYNSVSYYFHFIGNVNLPLIDSDEYYTLRDYINGDEEIKNKVMEKIRMYEL